MANPQSTTEQEEDLNVAVAERVLGMSIRRTTPEWYGREVTLFYWPNDPLIAYSWDENACNAMMYRNGKDDSNGTAPSLPFYDSDLDQAWEVVLTLRERGGDVWARFDSFLRSATPLWHGSQDDAARAICLAALRAVPAPPTSTEDR